MLHAILQVEKWLIYFSGILVDIEALHQHLIIAENILQPALKLWQIIKLKKYNLTMALAIDRITYKLINLEIRKKTPIIDIISDF